MTSDDDSFEIVERALTTTAVPRAKAPSPPSGLTSTSASAPVATDEASSSSSSISGTSEVYVTFIPVDPPASESRGSASEGLIPGDIGYADRLASSPDFRAWLQDLRETLPPPPTPELTTPFLDTLIRDLGSRYTSPYLLPTAVRAAEGPGKAPPPGTMTSAYLPVPVKAAPGTPQPKPGLRARSAKARAQALVAAMAAETSERNLEVEGWLTGVPHPARIARVTMPWWAELDLPSDRNRIIRDTAQFLEDCLYYRIPAYHTQRNPRYDWPEETREFLVLRDWSAHLLYPPVIVTNWSDAAPHIVRQHRIDGPADLGASVFVGVPGRTWSRRILEALGYRMFDTAFHFAPPAPQRPLPPLVLPKRG